MAEQIENSISQELTKLDWRLAEPRSAFVAALQNELRALDPDLANIESPKVARMIKRCYSRVLYTACSAPSTATHTRAYVELRAYLAAHARHLLPEQPEVAQEITQHAVAQILEHYTECRDDGLFLGWCQKIVVNAYRDRMRKGSRIHQTPAGPQRTKREISWEEILEPEGDGEPRMTTGTLVIQADTVMGAALRGPMLEKLLETLRRCLEKERRVRVLVELFFNDKTFAELARELALSALNVQVIKSRALEILRHCLEMQQLYDDWYV